MKPLFKLVKKANEVLEDLVRKYDKYSHIIYMESLTEFKFFDTCGKLTSSGKSSFWREIDTQMRCFDRGDTDLMVKESNKLQKGERKPSGICRYDSQPSISRSREEEQRNSRIPSWNRRRGNLRC